MEERKEFYLLPPDQMIADLVENDSIHQATFHFTCKSFFSIHHSNHITILLNFQFESQEYLSSGLDIS